MKKHYAFVPLKDSDFKAFRKSLMGDLWFRPIFCLILLVSLLFLGYVYNDELDLRTFSFFLFSFSFAFILYQLIRATQKLLSLLTMKKKSMLIYIKPVKGDSTFYKEEVGNGFIIQIEPITFLDINKCREELSLFLNEFEDKHALVDYLKACLSSTDRFLQNKAVVYMEIIRDQVAKGNLSILDTIDTLVNFKEDLS